MAGKTPTRSTSKSVGRSSSAKAGGGRSSSTGGRSTKAAGGGRSGSKPAASRSRSGSGTSGGTRTGARGSGRAMGLNKTPQQQSLTADQG